MDHKTINISKISFLFSLLMMAFIIPFVSCQKEKEVELDIPYKPKLVAGMVLIAGDSIASAIITRTTPVVNVPFPEGPSYYSNAQVLLSNPNQQLQLTYDSFSNMYYALSANTFKPNEQYDISIQSEYGKTTGSTILPLPATTEISVSQTIVKQNTYNEVSIRLNCTNTSSGNRNIKLIPVAIFSDSSRAELISTDEVKVYEVAANQSFINSFSTFVSPGTEIVRIELEVLSCDIHYTRYVNTTQGLYLQELPFVEPKIPYSNLSSKIGILASICPSGYKTFLLK
jgi:hypothetical protein